MNKITFIALGLALAGLSAAQTAVFDGLTPDATDANGQFADYYIDGPVDSNSNLTGLYNQFGEAITLSGPTTITGMDLALNTFSNSFNSTTTTYSEIQETDDISAVVSIYSTVSTSTKSGSIFSNLLSSTTVDFGTGYDPGYIYTADSNYDSSGNYLGASDSFALNPATTTTGKVGILVTFLVNGVASNEVGLGFNLSLADAVGSNTNTAKLYYGSDASSSSIPSVKSDINFASYGYTNADLGLALYSTQAVPEPISMSLLGLGAVTLLARRRK